MKLKSEVHGIDINTESPVLSPSPKVTALMEATLIDLGVKKGSQWYDLIKKMNDVFFLDGVNRMSHIFKLLLDNKISTDEMIKFLQSVSHENTNNTSH